MLVSANLEVAKASALDLEIWGKNGRQKVVREFSEAAAIKPFMELVCRLVPLQRQRIGIAKTSKLSDMGMMHEPSKFKVPQWSQHGN